MYGFKAFIALFRTKEADERWLTSFYCLVSFYEVCVLKRPSCDGGLHSSEVD